MGVCTDFNLGKSQNYSMNKDEEFELLLELIQKIFKKNSNNQF